MALCCIVEPTNLYLSVCTLRSIPWSQRPTSNYTVIVRLCVLSSSPTRAILCGVAFILRWVCVIRVYSVCSYTFVLVIRDEYLLAYYGAYRCYRCVCHATEPSKLGFTFYRVRSVYRHKTYGALISVKTHCGWSLEKRYKTQKRSVLLTQILHCNRPFALYTPYRRIRVSDSRINKYFR